MKFSVHKDIRKAKTIDTSAYTDPRIFEQSKEKIFAPSWQFIGDTGSLPELGTVLPVILLEDFLDEPLVLTRDKNDVIRCLSNVCTHRGNLVATKSGNASRLRCGYHGRVFGLDGQFQFMPEFEEAENFPCAADNLKNLPLFRWGNLLFTSLTNDFLPETFFAEMQKRVAFLPLDKMEYRADLSKDYSVHCNWALYCENYLEGFHIPFVHDNLSAVIDYGNYRTELFPFANLQVGIAKKGDVCFDLPSDSPDFGQQIAAYYFWVFPNMMFNFYPWGLSFNLVEPKGLSETRVRFLVYVWDASKLEIGAGAGLDTVELEDEEIVEQVQRGVRSRFYSGGRFSPKREQGPHHFHGLLARFFGKGE